MPPVTPECACCGLPVRHRNEHRQFRDGRPVRYLCRYSEAWLEKCRAILEEIEAERELSSDCAGCGASVIRYANSPTLYELDRATGHNCASNEDRRPAVPPVGADERPPGRQGAAVSVPRLAGG